MSDLEYPDGELSYDSHPYPYSPDSDFPESIFAFVESSLTRKDHVQFSEAEAELYQNDPDDTLVVSQAKDGEVSVDDPNECLTANDRIALLVRGLFLEVVQSSEDMEFEAEDGVDDGEMA